MFVFLSWKDVPANMQFCGWPNVPTLLVVRFTWIFSSVQKKINLKIKKKRKIVVSSHVFSAQNIPKNVICGRGYAPDHAKELTALPRSLPRCGYRYVAGKKGRRIGEERRGSTERGETGKRRDGKGKKEGKGGRLREGRGQRVSINFPSVRTCQKRYFIADANMAKRHFKEHVARL